MEVFGNPTENAHYTMAMSREISSRGHDVIVVTKTAAQVMAALEKIVVNEEADRLQASGGICMS